MNTIFGIWLYRVNMYHTYWSFPNIGTQLFVKFMQKACMGVGLAKRKVAWPRHGAYFSLTLINFWEDFSGKFMKSGLTLATFSLPAWPSWPYHEVISPPPVHFRETSLTRYRHPHITRWQQLFCLKKPYVGRAWNIRGDSIRVQQSGWPTWPMGISPLTPFILLIHITVLFLSSPADLSLIDDTAQDMPLLALADQGLTRLQDREQQSNYCTELRRESVCTLIVYKFMKNP